MQKNRNVLPPLFRNVPFDLSHAVSERGKAKRLQISSATSTERQKNVQMNFCNAK